MTADPILKERLSHAVADVPLDVEQRLAEIRGGRRSPSQEPRSRRPLTFLVAAALVALIGLVLWQVRPATDRGVADTSVQPTGTIAYASEVGAGTDTFDVHAYALETASSDDVLVVAGEVPDESPFVRWSPDGTRLAYVRTGEHPAIVIANADGSSPQDVDVGVPSNTASSPGPRTGPASHSPRSTPIQSRLPHHSRSWISRRATCRRSGRPTAPGGRSTGRPTGPRSR
jgi:hypothetical protein